MNLEPRQRGRVQ